MKISLILFFLCFICFSCSTGQRKDEYSSYKKNNPHMYLENRAVAGKRLSDKYVELSPRDIESLQESFAGVKHLTINPVPVNKNSKYYSWFKKEINNIPLPVQKLLAKRVHGWSLVDNLGASATVFGLLDEYHYPEKGIVLLDVSLFKKSYKELCSYKESTVYNLEENEMLECDYRGTNISFAKAVFYHEAGHLFGNLNALFSKKMKSSLRKYYPFNRLSWLEHGYSHDQVVSLFDGTIPYRKDIRYYSNDKRTKIPKGVVGKNLKGWQLSNFFTLYSMSDANEDWAETFAHYFITKYHGGRYVVQHKNPNGNVVTYRSCEDSDSCSKKMKLMEVYIKNIDLFI